MPVGSQQCQPGDEGQVFLTSTFYLLPFCNGCVLESCRQTEAPVPKQSDAPGLLPNGRKSSVGQLTAHNPAARDTTHLDILLEQGHPWECWKGKTKPGESPGCYTDRTELSIEIRIVPKRAISFPYRVYTHTCDFMSLSSSPLKYASCDGQA